jgi:hypothetical protein
MSPPTYTASRRTPKQKLALENILRELESDWINLSGSGSSSLAGSPVLESQAAFTSLPTHVLELERPFLPIENCRFYPLCAPTAMNPTEIVTKLLANATDLAVVEELVAEDATYISLNHSNPELQSVRTPTHTPPARQIPNNPRRSSSGAALNPKSVPQPSTNLSSMSIATGTYSLSPPKPRLVAARM